MHSRKYLDGVWGGRIGSGIPLGSAHQPHNGRVATVVRRLHQYINLGGAVHSAVLEVEWKEDPKMYIGPASQV